MKTTIRRNLVIGLGGTGLNAVYNLKRRYQRIFGTPRPLGTRFLVLDTTQPQDQDGVRLEGGEFISLVTQDPRRVLEVNKEVKRWFPTKPAIPLSTIANGASQIRPLGRLALFHNANRVIAQLEQIVTEVLAIEQGTLDGEIEVAEGQGILISIIGSISGGTGSGTFLDVGFICRHLLSDKGEAGSQSKVLGFVLLPGVFKGLPSTANVEANSYAAMKELDYYMALTSGQESRLAYTSQLTIDIKNPPFTNLYVVNNLNRKGQAFTGIPVLCEQISLAAFLHAGGIGKSTTDVLDNTRGRAKQEDKAGGKWSSYGSLGISELVLDRDRASDELALRIARAAIGKAFARTDERDSGVEDFLRANHLVEHDADQLTDALLKPEAEEPLLHDVVGKKDLLNIRGIVSAYVNNVDVDFKKRLDSITRSFLDERVDRLEERIQDTVAQDGGVFAAIRFLEGAIGSLRGYSEEMMIEAREYDEKREASGLRLKAYQDEAETTADKFFAGKGAVREIVENVRVELLNLADAIAQSARRRRAQEVYSNLVEVIEDRLRKLKTLQERVDHCQFNVFEKELEKLHSRYLQKSGPFQVEVEVPPKFLALSDGDEQGLLAYLQQDENWLETLMSFSDEKLFEEFRAFGRTRNRVESLRRLTIDQVLDAVRKTDSKKAEQYVVRAYNLAAPLWNIDTAIASPEDLQLFGVSSTQENALQLMDLTSVLPEQARPHICEVGDPERIYVARIETPAPGFTISGMHMYKQHYERLRAVVPFHLEPEFVDEPALDLFPPGEESAPFRVWALANAEVFQLVVANGAHYKVWRKRENDPDEGDFIALPQGRVKARDALVGDSELVAELTEVIERKQQAAGVDVVLNKLKEHVIKLKDMEKKATDESLIRLIREETRAVNEYITEYQKLA
jgi:hypothetical protein